MNPSYLDVYDVVAVIPSGRVTSYGAIARFLGLSSPRIVGRAMSKLDCGHSLPAHRVLNSQGYLSGAACFTPEGNMVKLLLAEGHTVKNGRLMNFKAVFWDPSIEIQ